MADIETLLARTSRTFAITIPFLPSPPKREITVTYLILRIADTFEDATTWPQDKRLAALTTLSALLESRSPHEARQISAAWVNAKPCEHHGYLELLGETPRVLTELDAFDLSRRAVIVHHARRTITGMASFIRSTREDGCIALSSKADLQRYCYVVAGIVGELLTDLFLDVVPGLAQVERTLRARAAAFGEGLQLVNILKDEADDARDGRVYLPVAAGRGDVLALARRDLDAATEYVYALQSAGAPRGVVAFCAFPVLLARLTLGEVERRGPGTKVSRSAVASLLARMNAALDHGTPAIIID
ncbi:MAG TPA: squalene/phytoene synthase family protein [Sorangium sp.]|nr:squalene/phytoene synthase family protein [Sorangium sp.]